MKRKDRKGFTLAELLVVVAIIAVLVAIAIPIFTSQLEKSREATDAANIRSQYAEVMTDAITNSNGDVNANHDKYAAIDLKQTKNDWQSTELGTNLNSLFGTDHIIGDGPNKGGIAWVSYDAKDNCAVLHYEGGTGNSSAGSSDSNGTGENTDNAGEDKDSATFPGFKINNVIPFEIKKEGVSVTKGNVYSYQGNYYVCIADYKAGSGWSDYSNVTPEGNKWPYIQLTDKSKVLTEADYFYDGNKAHFESKDGINKGTIYKNSVGKLYILTADYGTSWCDLPENNANWVQIKS